MKIIQMFSYFSLSKYPSVAWHIFILPSFLTSVLCWQINSKHRDTVCDEGCSQESYQRMVLSAWAGCKEPADNDEEPSETTAKHPWLETVNGKYNLSKFLHISNINILCT